MLVRFDPFRDTPFAAGTAARRPSALALDAIRRGDEFQVKIDLPGVDAETIDVTVDRTVLTVTATRDDRAAEGDRVLAAERPQGTFTRRVLLSERLDASRVSASYDRGVLTVTVPVAEESKPRKVAVMAGGPAISPEVESAPQAEIPAGA